MNAILVVSGFVCLGLCALVAPSLRPREGKPVPPWMRTESRETAATLGLFTLFVAGLALLAKGFSA